MSERLNTINIESPQLLPTPRAIVSETAVLLPMYFSDTLEDEKHALDYFKGPTTNFVINMNRGFALSTGINLTNNSREDLSRLLHSASDLTSDDTDLVLPRRRAIESFNLAVVIFSQMPEYADSSKYSLLSSNRVAVHPPRTSLEILERIEELKQFMDDLNTKRITYKNVRKLSLEDKLFRSISFFQVGKDLPLKELPKKEEVVELLKNAFH